MKSSLEQVLPDVSVSLKEGGNGLFEVRADGRTIYSKKKSGRFPNDNEIIGALRSGASAR